MEHEELYILVEHRPVVQAAHPDHKTPLPIYVEDEQRVGTARRETDGSYILNIAFPVSGQIRMRPMRPDESPDAMRKEGR